jgi:hypothetical protein
MTEKLRNDSTEFPVYRDLSFAEIQALVQQGRQEQSKAVRGYVRSAFRVLRDLFKTAPKHSEAGKHGVPAKA